MADEKLSKKRLSTNEKRVVAALMFADQMFNGSFPLAVRRCLRDAVVETLGAVLGDDPSLGDDVFSWDTSRGGRREISVRDALRFFEGVRL